MQFNLGAESGGDASVSGSAWVGSSCRAGWARASTLWGQGCNWEQKKLGGGDRITACCLSQPEWGSTTFHRFICGRGVRGINLLILHPASLFPDCSLPLISQYRFCLPLCSCLLLAIFNNKTLFPKTWRLLFLHQICFHIMYINDLFLIHKNL